MIIPRYKPPILMAIYSQILHAFPYIKSGLTVLSFNFVTNKLFGSRNDPVVARLLNGIQIEVLPNDYHGRILYLFGTNDPKVNDTVRGLLAEGDLFLDIGANYSSIGLAASSWVGPTGEVHLFEPQSAISLSVQASIANARLSNVELHRVALLDHDGEMTISSPKHHSGMATLVQHGGDRREWRTETVQVRATAPYLSRVIRGRRFAAKLDVEGAEPVIMPWLLEQPNLGFLVFEAVSNQNQLWELCKAHGLAVYGLRRNLFRTRIRLLASFEDMREYHDLVAVRLPTSRRPIRETSPSKLGRLLRL